MNCLEIIEKYYTPKTPLYNILISHSVSVKNKALRLAHQSGVDVDIEFVGEAAMIHDIGIFQTNAPTIHCYGTHDYIEHGYLGAAIMLKEGFPRHAMVCERHTGTGIALKEIVTRKLPLPHREMSPITLEEQLVCYADLFFSKTKLEEELKLPTIRYKVGLWGEDSLCQLDKWIEMFGY